MRHIHGRKLPHSMNCDGLVRSREGSLVNSSNLREQSRVYRAAAKMEATLRLRRYLASHALALAQLAEKIDRKIERKKASEDPRY